MKDADMYQLASMFSQLNTFQGNAHPLKGMSGGFMNMSQRLKEEEKKRKQMEALSLMVEGDDQIQGLLGKGTQGQKFVGGLLNAGMMNQAVNAMTQMMKPQDNDPMSPIGKLMADREALLASGVPENDPRITYYDNALMKAGMPGGMNLTVNPDGTVNFSQGTQSGLTKPMQNKVQEKLFNAHDQIARLRDIKAAYKPEFLQIGTRAGLTFTELKDKFNMGTISPEENQQINEYATFKRRSISNLNTYINQMSGAAVSEQEAKRLLGGLPNSGQGVFDGDSPSIFKSKLDDTAAELKRASIRYQYAISKGLNWNNIPLSRVDQILDERGMEIERTLKSQNPGLPPEQIDQMVRLKLAEEFGL